MFGVIGTGLWTVAKWFLGEGGIISKGFDLAAKKADVAHLDLATLSEEKRIVLLEALKGDTARVQTQQSLVLAAMMHPVWWWAWGLFVFPVGLYHAMIFLSSTIPWLNWWSVLRVPPTQEQWALSIIQTIFVAQVGTGVAAAVAQSIQTIFKK